MNEWETLKERAKELEENYDEDGTDVLYEDIQRFHKKLITLNESEKCNIHNNAPLVLGIRVVAGKFKKALDRFKKENRQLEKELDD